ncbi:uncharacterized protein [Dermacentor albipictus]
MSGADEPVEEKGSGEDVAPGSYPSGGNYNRPTRPADVLPTVAPKTLSPPPPYTTGTKRPKEKVTAHKRLPSSKGPSTTTPAAVYKRTTPTIPKTPSTTVPTPTTTLPPTTTTTTVPPRLPLVCTVMDYPSGLADNICDHLFYDSLYRDSQSTFVGITNGVKTFLEAAASSSLTRFGFSVEVSALKTFSSEFKSSDGQKYWKQYLEKRVYDWGFLNVNERHFQDNPDVLKEALTMMKNMDEYQKQQTPIQAYMMLGVFFMPTSCDQVAQKFKTIFLPAHVILLGQISYGTHKPCVALPANNYIDPRQEMKSLTHGHTLRQATESAKCLQTKGINTSYSVSIEMESMQFQHGPGRVRDPADKRLYTGCSSSDSYQRLSLTILCATGPTTRHYQDHYKTNYALDKTEKFLNTFDTKESLQFKVCDAWRDYGSSRIGISAYSVNADFPHPIFQCPKDQWAPDGSRLRLVQGFGDFLRKESGGRNPKATFFDRCRQLT